MRICGFSGFLTVSQLRDSGLAAVPQAPGVYIVAGDSVDHPSFQPRSPAGHLKGRDPTLGNHSLREAWVPDTCVVYIGKAGGDDRRTNLRIRLRAYLRHGAGHRAGHWGGRAIWQLSDADRLLFGWKVLSTSPRDLERALLEEFVQVYGRRPFANRAS